MWKKFYSNSGLVLLAVLAAGVWFSNVMPLLPARNAAEHVNFDVVPAASPTPIDRVEEFLKRAPITVEQALNATARCKDGALSYSHSRRGACSRHGGVAQWFSK